MRAVPPCAQLESVTRPHPSTRRPIIECVISSISNTFPLRHSLIVILNRRVVSAFLTYRIVSIAWCRFEIAFPYRTRGHATCHSSKRFVVALFREWVCTFSPRSDKLGRSSFLNRTPGVSLRVREAHARAVRIVVRTRAVVLSVSVEAIRVLWRYSLRQ